VADIATVSRPPTPIQAAARATADVLLAGKAPPVPPGKYTLRWNQIATVDANPGRALPTALDVANLLLVTKTAQTLVDDLRSRFNRSGQAKPKIHAHFMELKDFPEKGHTDAAGYFKPETPDEASYDVYVMWEKDLRPNDLFNRGETRNLRRGQSFMAHSLFHELLHVWFIHAHRGAGTGHSGGVMHPEFAKRLEAVTLELEKLEQAR
jgi:hypothetical protein